MIYIVSVWRFRSFWQYAFCINRLNDVLVAYFFNSVSQNDVLEIVILNLSLIFSYIRFSSVFSLYNIQEHVDGQDFDVVDSIIQIGWFHCGDHILFSLYDVISSFELRKASNVFFFFFLVSHVDCWLIMIQNVLFCWFWMILMSLRIEISTNCWRFSVRFLTYFFALKQWGAVLNQ